MTEVHRKRIKHYEVERLPRFLTFSCYQRLPLFSNDHIKVAFVERIQLVRKRIGFRLHGWVVMPEHVHLLITPQLPEFPVPKVLESLKKRFAQTVISRWKSRHARILDRVVDRRGRYHFWQQGPGHDRNIRDEREYFSKLEYIHGNPIQRGLVETAADWPWSSARWYLGCDDALLSIDPL